MITLVETPIAGLYKVHTSPARDKRGRFSRIYCRSEFASVFPEPDFDQINLSRTEGRGTVRGLHFQHAPFAETKLIRCIRGHVFDVAVDLRRDSPTWLCTFPVELSEDSDTEILIPKGCAHGFQVLSESCELLYLHTATWNQLSEGGVRFDDPALAIEWPLPAENVSDRDLGFRLIDQHFAGVRL
jgi:dTDP-4-dehydrorhamnose 3,5-epimerase